MRHLTISRLAVIPFLLMGACNRPECSNTNPVFERFAPGSQEYKTELARQIRQIGPDKLRYWYEGYRQQEQQEYIIADIQGNGICAKGEILVTDWKGIEGLRGSEENGYRGAELSGMKLQVVDNPGGADLIFRGLESIID